MRKILLGLVGIVCALFATSSYAATTCVNLFDPTKAVLGDINTNGVIGELSYRIVSDFIPVVPGQKYVVSGQMYMANSGLRDFGPFITGYYNANKEFISGSRIAQSNRFITIPDGVSYARVEYGAPTNEGTAIIAQSKLQFEQGDTATTYCSTCEGQLYSGQWNQYVPNGNFSTKGGWVSSGGTITAENNTLRFVKDNADVQGVVYQSYSDFIVGNKYLITAQVKGPVSADHTFGGGGSGSSPSFSFSITNSNEYKTISGIVIPNTASNTFYFYLQGGSAGAEFDIKNVMAFNLTQMFGAGNEPATAEEAERLIPVIASSLNISATDGYYATNTGQAYSYCVTIKIATTKYVETQFSDLGTRLAAAVQTVNTVVTNTINQAASIATLQSGKQTRPADDTCPAYKQCLLVEDESGTPHWYQITDPFRDFVAPIIANNVNAASSTSTQGYTQLEYIESTGTQYIDTGIVVQEYSGLQWETNVAVVDNQLNAYNIMIGVEMPRIMGPEFLDTGKIGWGFGNSFGTTDTTFSLNTKYKFYVKAVSGDYKIFMDNNLIYSNTGTTTYPTQNVYLFADNVNGRSIINSKIKLYNIKIWNGAGTTLVRNFVPVVENATGKVGMYDTVGGRFYGNAATSGDDFTPGPIVENDADVPGATWTATWAADASTGVSAGTVYGIARCSNATSTAGTIFTDTTSTEFNTLGRLCYCKMTSIDFEGSISDTNAAKWVRTNSANGGTTACLQLCGIWCKGFTTMTEYNKPVLSSVL